MDTAQVKSLSLTYTQIGEIALADTQGNPHRQKGNYTTAAAIDALPDLTGYGTLGSLHQAMARDVITRAAANNHKFVRVA